MNQAGFYLKIPLVSHLVDSNMKHDTSIFTLKCFIANVCENLSIHVWFVGVFSLLILQCIKCILVLIDHYHLNMHPYWKVDFH